LPQECVQLLQKLVPIPLGSDLHEAAMVILCAFRRPRCLLFALVVLSSLSETVAHLVQREFEETTRKDEWLLGGNLSPLVAAAAPLQVPVRSPRPGALRITRRKRAASPAMQLPDLGKAVSDFGSGLASKATGALTGQSEEEAKAMEERMKAGEMSFDDFLKQVEVMQKGAGMQDMLGKLGGGANVDLAAGRKKMESYAKYIEAMEPEERGGDATQALIDEALAGRSGGQAPRLQRIADATGASLEDVGRFVLEFKMMRSATVKFANGESPESIRASMEQEQRADGVAAPLNRQQRRAAKKKKKKGSASSSGFR